MKPGAEKIIDKETIISELDYFSDLASAYDVAIQLAKPDALMESLTDEPLLKERSTDAFNEFMEERTLLFRDLTIRARLKSIVQSAKKALFTSESTRFYQDLLSCIFLLKWLKANLTNVGKMDAINRVDDVCMKISDSAISYYLDYLKDIFRGNDDLRNINVIV